MAVYDSISTAKDHLIRKALSGGLFLALPSQAELATIVDATGAGIATLATGWKDGGLMTDEGMRFSRAVESSDVTSFSRFEPSRSDITSDVLTVQADFQETNIQTISLFTGAAVASLVPDETTGELVIEKPSRPAPSIYQILALGVDETAAGEIYAGVYLPRAKVTAYADQAFAKGDAPIQWGVTFQAQNHSGFGYSQKNFFGGPGWKALLVDMGFPAAG